jgi:hypothetical protein
VHPKLVEELIAEEVERVRANDLLRERVRLEQRDRGVLAHARRADGDVLFAFDGPNYNAEPFQFTVLDTAAEQPLEAGAWPPGLAFGGPHPTLNRAWTCLRGTYEYHCHSSHLEDAWDQHRYSLDLPTLLGQILNKSGCA